MGLLILLWSRICICQKAQNNNSCRLCMCSLVEQELSCMKRLSHRVYRHLLARVSHFFSYCNVG